MLRRKLITSKSKINFRERPPKKTKGGEDESVMKNIVKDVVEAQQRSDEMFLKNGREAHAVRS